MGKQLFDIVLRFFPKSGIFRLAKN